MSAFKPSILDSNDDLRAAVRHSLDARKNHGYLMDDPDFIRNHIRTEVFINHAELTGTVKIFLVSRYVDRKVLLAIQDFVYENVLNFNKENGNWDSYSERFYGEIKEFHDGKINDLI